MIRLAFCLKDGDGVEKDEKKANDLFQRVASIDNGDKLLWIARGYVFGRGVSQYKGKAAELYQIAADNGNILAIVKLGSCYEFGYGVPQNVDKAIELYQKAAEKGHTYSLFKLTERLIEGDGVPQDKKKAIEFLQQLADMGNIDAMSILGDCYMKGDDVTQDKKKAIELYQQAARMGSVNAMIKLGVLHAEGDFDAQGKVNAIQWFQKAVNLYNAHEIDSFTPCDDDEEVQQAKEQFIELIRQADEMSETDVITKLGIHWFDGVDTEQDNRMTIHPDLIIGNISKAYAIVCIAISLMKEKSVRQDTNPTKLIQRARAIWSLAFKIAKSDLCGDIDPLNISYWGFQVVPHFPQRFNCIIVTLARLMLGQLKKEQH